MGKTVFFLVTEANFEDFCPFYSKFLSPLLFTKYVGTIGSNSPQHLRLFLELLALNSSVDVRLCGLCDLIYTHHEIATIEIPKQQGYLSFYPKKVEFIRRSLYINQIPTINHRLFPANQPIQRKRLLIIPFCIQSSLIA